MTRPVRATAPAKLNLVLEVVGRRDDGYHDVDTLMVALDWADTLVVTARDGGAVVLDGGGEAWSDDVPRDATNLAVRAAEGVRAAAGGGGVALRLDKSVPSGAGLGGGSADAAAAALATARALGAHLPDGLLAGLGADCAFFAEAAATGIARCTGRGERVEPLPAPPPWSAVVLVPEGHASTALVYGALRGTLSARGDAPTVHQALFAGSAADLRRGLRNDLEAAALAAVPALRPVRELLDASGAAHFRLSGSGAGFFGLYDDEAEARVALAELTREAARRGVVLRAARHARFAGAGVQLEDA